MAVTLDAALLDRYPRFSLYNSPYAAHDAGAAIDLYPEVAIDGDDDRDPADGGPAPSPVAGEVLDTRTVDAPSKPYAVEQDHLILVDTGEHVTRVLHVDPTVSAGDRVAAGDSLGRLIRSGFFAPWVDDHVHLGFRPSEANHYRASGSLRLELGVDVRPVQWDGTGTVVETGGTYAVLDTPAHPDPGDCFAGVAATVDGRPCVLDGGFPHYEGGGVLGGAAGPVAFLGERVGTSDGRTVAWDDVTVQANGEPITGLSLFCGRDSVGVKLVRPDHGFAVGDGVDVAVARD
ncbi:hypothetical protein BV210_10515 [Halorientalis sp. IM1011]|uniref:hypothetical protein n=1 Tax=Halorientalis sp. IM1011 TaxID=1932360 RepID=UPI00097CC0E0|nr:hypothetical protein [Halorientalis sp. IM1011]AQL43121.1 hypothetical protein BV210_10515 [Halorientalis sp. IM1011]